MAEVPVLLYRGMDEEEYEEAKQRGYFESGQHRYRDIMFEIENAEDQETLERWESELQARELAGEFDLTFWADTYANAANYGEIVVTIRTKGIERQFEPFLGRPGELVTAEPVPFGAMHGAQLQLHRTRFETWVARRPDVRVHRHRRRQQRLKY